MPQAASTVSGPVVTIWGYADDGWGVDRVEVSVDGGATWQEALLGEEASAIAGVPVPEPRPPADSSPRGPVKIYLPLAHSGRAANGTVLWAIQVPTNATDLVIRSRAVDPAGNVEVPQPPVRVRRM
jgi:hypothetical protein